MILRLEILYLFLLSIEYTIQEGNKRSPGTIMGSHHFKLEFHWNVPIRDAIFIVHQVVEKSIKFAKQLESHECFQSGVTTSNMKPYKKEVSCNIIRVIIDKHRPEPK